MAQYYYTVSALPYLTYDGGLRLSIDDFLSLCRDTLSPLDWSILEKIGLRGSFESGNGTHAAWTVFETALRGEIAKLRAQKRGAESDAPRQGALSALVIDTARAAVNEISPTAAEDLLLRTLWRFLDELEVGHHFDLDKIILYYLRLRILELKDLRNKEKGREEFTRLYETIRKEHNPNIQ